MIAAVAQQHRFNPVLDWFSGLKWDGVKRLDKMLTTYFGADDTPYHRAIGRKHLCAMVRRAKQPGAKYDYVLTLDGPQSIGKSMFCEDLAVWPDLYADTGILADSPREAMEQLGGKWSIEIGELAGYGSSTRERIKAFITRKSERARAAYAHFARDQLRSCVFTATKNPGGFLNDPTGERRWWIAKISRYDREGFLKDREHLFAEAVAVEPAEKLWLETPELKAAQAAAATAAKAPNDLVDELDDIEGVVFGSEERISIADVRERLGITKTDAARDMRLAGRIADAMAHLGWEKPSHSIRCTRLEGMPPVKGFRRLISDEERTRREERDAAYARDSGPAQGVLGPWPTKRLP
jgi:predicted P-loop ATPase